MAIILNNKKSTYGSPYAYYTAEVLSISNRTSASVDLEIKITSNLAYASSRLGSGYTLKANFDFLNSGSWSSDITLKASSDSWSGTTKHYKTTTMTVNGLSSTDTLLDSIKFRVVSSASDHSAGLNSTACSSVEIPSAYIGPSLTTSWTEQNQDLISIGIPNGTIVNNLSIKRFVLTITFHQEEERLSKIQVLDANNVIIYESSNATFNVDFSTINLIETSSNKTKIRFKIINTWGDETLYYPIEFDYIAYTKPYIIETTTKAKRIGQLSGNVGLTINGNYYNDEIVENVRPSIQHIYYKYWEVGTTEPATYSNEIPSASITASDGEFNVNSYVVNNIDPTKAYRFKIKVEDNFNNVESSELSVAVGESVWDEYKDRVDFKKLTIQGHEIKYKNILNAKPTSDLTLSTTSYTQIPLELNNYVGDVNLLTGNKLYISSDDGIKIGAGVSKVLVSANILFLTGGSGATRKGLAIYQNNDLVVYNNINGDTTYTGASISQHLIDVAENDIIYLYGINQGASGSIVSQDNTFITVEVIE